MSSQSKDNKMRILGEIVDSARTGEEVSKDELLYALIAMSHLSTFDDRALMNLTDAEINGKKPVRTYSAEWQCQERMDRIHRVYHKSPKEFIGKDHDPKNPENCKRIKTAKKIFKDL